jgi:DNA-binding transcriptional MerR regulator
MEIQALCEEVNRLITSEGIEIENGRTSSLVTPRNIRYYCTIGIMPPPKRLDSKSTYDNSHVEAVMTIKRSQMAGLSLKEIKEQQHADVIPDFSRVLSSKSFASVSLNSVLAHRSERLITNSMSDVKFGWTVTIGSHQLSGFGVQPNEDQLTAIKQILDITSEANDFWKGDGE